MTPLQNQVCEIDGCGRFIQSAAGRKVHLKMYHNLPTTCPVDYCDRQYRLMQLPEHLIRMHKKSEMVCRFCKASFTIDEFIYHMKICTQVPAPKNDLPKILANRVNLTIESREIRRKSSCKYCQRVVFVDEMLQHLRNCEKRRSYIDNNSNNKVNPMQVFNPIPEKKVVMVEVPKVNLSNVAPGTSVLKRSFAANKSIVLEPQVLELPKSRPNSNNFAAHKPKISEPQVLELPKNRPQPNKFVKIQPTVLEPQVLELPKKALKPQVIQLSKNGSDSGIFVRNVFNKVVNKTLILNTRPEPRQSSIVPLTGAKLNALKRAYAKSGFDKEVPNKKLMCEDTTQDDVQPIVQIKTLKDQSILIEMRENAPDNKREKPVKSYTIGNRMLLIDEPLVHEDTTPIFDPVESSDFEYSELIQEAAKEKKSINSIFSTCKNTQVLIPKDVKEQFTEEFEQPKIKKELPEVEIIEPQDPEVEIIEPKKEPKNFESNSEEVEIIEPKKEPKDFESTTEEVAIIEPKQEPKNFESDMIEDDIEIKEEFNGDWCELNEEQPSDNLARKEEEWCEFNGEQLLDKLLRKEMSQKDHMPERDSDSESEYYGDFVMSSDVESENENEKEKETEKTVVQEKVPEVSEKIIEKEKKEKEKIKVHKPQIKARKIRRKRRRGKRWTVRKARTAKKIQAKEQEKEQTQEEEEDEKENEVEMREQEQDAGDEQMQDVETDQETENEQEMENNEEAKDVETDQETEEQDEENKIEHQKIQVVEDMREKEHEAEDVSEKEEEMEYEQEVSEKQEKENEVERTQEEDVESESEAEEMRDMEEDNEEEQESTEEVEEEAEEEPETNQEQEKVVVEEERDKVHEMDQDQKVEQKQESKAEQEKEQDVEQENVEDVEQDESLEVEQVQEQEKSRENIQELKKEQETRHENGREMGLEQVQIQETEKLEEIEQDSNKVSQIEKKLETSQVLEEDENKEPEMEKEKEPIIEIAAELLDDALPKELETDISYTQILDEERRELSGFYPSESIVSMDDLPLCPLELIEPIEKLTLGIDGPIGTFSIEEVPVTEEQVEEPEEKVEKLEEKVEESEKKAEKDEPKQDHVQKKKRGRKRRKMQMKFKKESMHTDRVRTRLSARMQKDFDLANVKKEKPTPTSNKKRAAVSYPLNTDHRLLQKQIHTVIKKELEEVRAVAQDESNCEDSGKLLVTCPFKNCHKRFKSAYLYQHVKVVHHKVKPRCTHCNKEVVPSHLRQHERICSSDGQKHFKCKDEKCTATFRTFREINQHVWHVHRRPVPCPIKGCESMVKPAGLKKHIRSVHENIQGQCNHCGKSFKKKYLPQHIKVCTTTMEKKFCCTVQGCTALFRMQHEIKAHIWRVHRDPIPCPFEGCNVTVNPVRLERHIKFIHDKMKVKCNMCGKAIMESSLPCHTKYCTGEAKYKCVVKGCKEVFKYSLERSEHVNEVHAMAHKCPYPGCDKLFLKATVLTHHIKVIHEKPLEICNHCNKEIRSSYLYKHKKLCVMAQQEG